MHKLLTRTELAAVLRICPRQVDKLAATGRLPAPVRLGRSVRWRVSDAEKFVACGCDLRAFTDAERQAVERC